MTLQSIFTLHNAVMGMAALLTLFLLAKIMKTVIYAVYGCVLAIAIYTSASSVLLKYIPKLHDIPYGETLIPALLCVAISLCMCQLIDGIPFALARFLVGLLLLAVFAAPTILRHMLLL